MPMRRLRAWRDSRVDSTPTKRKDKLFLILVSFSDTNLHDKRFCR
jgi:hypothetical protein